MIPQIEQYILENWEKFSSNKPEKISSLLLSNPQGKKITHSKCTVLVFFDNKDIPSVVCKFVRTKEEECSKIINEHNILHSFGTIKNIAKPYALAEINGRKVSFEEFKSGKSIKSNFATLINMHSIMDVNEVVNVITTDFGDLSTLINSLNKTEFDEKISQNNYVCRAFANKLNLFNIIRLSTEEKELVGEIIERYVNVNQQNSRIVHFDLTPNNVIRNKDSLAIIDFEFGAVSNHLFIDPVRFLFYYFYMCHEMAILPYDSYESNFYYFFSKKSPVYSTVDKFMRSIKGLSIDKLHLWEYLILFLICNIQLQLEEVDIIDSDFISQTQKTIGLLLKLRADRNPELCSIRINSDDKLKNTNYNFELLKHKLIQVEKNLEEMKISLKEKEEQISENTQYIEKCHAVIAEKDIGLEENIKYIEKCHSVISEKDEKLAENAKYIEKCHVVISEKDERLEENKKYIENCHNVIAEKDATIEKYHGTLNEKQYELVNHINQLKLLNDRIQGLEHTVKELREVELRYKNTVSYKLKKMFSRYKR